MSAAEYPGELNHAKIIRKIIKMAEFDFWKRARGIFLYVSIFIEDYSWNNDSKP